MHKLNGRKRRLSTYASGDGALHFTWIDANNQCDSTGITRSIALRYLRQNVDAKHLKQDGWKVWTRHGRPVLVGPVERVNDNTLLVKGDRMTYSIKDVNDSWWVKEHLLRDYNLDLQFRHPELGLIKVRSISARIGVCHFLTHERELKENPPEA